MCSFKREARERTQTYVTAADTQKGRKTRPYMPFGAVTGIRTRDLHLTKVVLYRLSHNSIFTYPFLLYTLSLLTKVVVRLSHNSIFTYPFLLYTLSLLTKAMVRLSHNSMIIFHYQDDYAHAIIHYSAGIVNLFRVFSKTSLYLYCDGDTATVFRNA